MQTLYVTATTVQTVTLTNFISTFKNHPIAYLVHILAINYFMP